MSSSEGSSRLSLLSEQGELPGLAPCLKFGDPVFVSSVNMSGVCVCVCVGVTDVERCQNIVSSFKYQV